MNTNAMKWVAALRSGEYKQVTGNLRKGDGFCCLGVACDVFLKNGGELSIIYSGQIAEYDGRVGALPIRVRDWLGMRDRFGSIDELGTDLASLNDQGKPFDSIADVIDEHKDELFRQEESK